MKLDLTGENFIIKEEGMVLHPYLDSAGIPTIGVGCTYYEDGSQVKMTDEPITEERALQLFRTLVKTFEQTVTRVIRVPLTQNQFNALVSLCFNIGVSAFSRSTLVKKINARAPLTEIEVWFLVWNKVGGEAVLLGRRKREFELYTTL
ncbi:lysozyme [Pedobacter immunditicola]|uniref:lysozyme n=1 Tax=Pedobacter immunditicola TaxID=3133440 RepID=UPI0030A575AE